MTGPAPRIRWNETSPYTKAGQFGPFSFTIVRTATEPGWLLIAELPGLGRKQARSDALDELKAEAERWLEEFVSSLGAVFPTAEAVIVRCDELRAGDRLLDSDAMVTVRRVDTYDDHLGISVWAEEGRWWYLDRQSSSLVAVCRTAGEERTGDGEPRHA